LRRGEAFQGVDELMNMDKSNRVFSSLQKTVGGNKKGSLQRHTNLIKTEANRLGFLSCGISKAGFLEEEAPRLEKWLKESMQGEMKYMENHFDKRLDPRLLVDGAKSVISLLLNYFPEETQRKDTYKISKYAYGQDYHHVIKSKLRQLQEFISEEIGEVNGRAFVDSAPVLDKAWAAKSGLGWMGKHRNTAIFLRKKWVLFILLQN